MAKLFNISEATIIAFHSLAMMDHHKRITAAEVATTTRASKNHVLKILNMLSRHGYVKSIRGPGGGFHLNKNPEEIGLLEVFEMMEGPILASPCGLSPDQCPFRKCIFGDITFRLTGMFVDALKGKTVKDISRSNIQQLKNLNI
ncbi:MAG: Rrf2 family transcriptional regulator [Bacteroidales bacterium]